METMGGLKLSLKENYGTPEKIWEESVIASYLGTE